MNREVKWTAVALIIMFVCVYPMFVCQYGQYYGPVNYADDKRNYEWGYGIEVIIVPLVFFIVFSSLVLLSIKKRDGSDG